MSHPINVNISAAKILSIFRCGVIIGLLDLLRIKHFCAIEKACDLVATPRTRTQNSDIFHI